VKVGAINSSDYSGIRFLFLPSCKKQAIILFEYAGLQSVINEAVYFLLLKKINSAIIMFNPSEKAKL